MGWFANLFGFGDSHSYADDNRSFINDQIEVNNSIKKELDCIQAGLAEAQQKATNVTAWKDSLQDRLGQLADRLEEDSTDEFGYSGWWPKK